jgi:branched-chain amino acid transport system ATP-binding protein
MLELRNVSGGYGQGLALEDVTLEVRAQEAVALLGANGAGKTTTLRAISGVLPSVSGTIMFDGSDIGSWSPERRARAGLVHVPEGRQVFARLSVMKNLRAGGLAGAGRGRTDESLERVLELFPRLAERRHQAAGSLSGGEQQMLAIGRGLMARPKVLMLDEPSMGLAPLVVRVILDSVAEILSSGTAVLLVEQNARQALHRTSRAYVMRTGRLVLSKPSTEVLADPALRESYLGSTVTGSSA